MDGGLLEKAKTRDDGSDAEAVDSDVQEVAEAETNGTGLLERVVDEAPEGGGGGGLDRILAIATGLIGVVSMIFMSELPAFSGVGTLAAYGASFWFAMRYTLASSGAEVLTSRQWVTLGVAYLLLAGIPYVGGMDFGGATSITDATYSEDGSTVSLTIRHSVGLTGSSFDSGEVHVNVLRSGSSVHSQAYQLSLDGTDMLGPYGTLTLAVADFYSGNAVSVSGGTTTYANYTVEVQVPGSDPGRMNLDAYEMTRTVDDVDEKMTALFDEDSDCEAGKNRCVRGVYLEIAVGRALSSDDAGSAPLPISGTYWINASISHADSSDPVISYPTMAVNGHAATWDSEDGAYGNGSGTIGQSTSAMILDGSTTDDTLQLLYFPKDEWDEHGFGCYTFTVEVTQSPPWSGDASTTVSESGTYLWEDIEGEQHSGPGAEDDPDYEEFQRATC